MRLNYFKELDGIRGIAALMVMYFHFFNGMPGAANGIEKLLVKTAVFGQTGVILFFVLSGFLITRILLASKTSSHFFSNFYIRRSLRIFPLYYFALGVYLLSSHILHEGLYATFANSWYYWLYLQNIAMTFQWKLSDPLHFWSLAVEEHFYLFWPLIVYYSSTKRLPVIIYSIVVVAIILRLFIYSGGYQVFYFTGTTMDALAIGSLLAVKETRQSKPSPVFNLFLFAFIMMASVGLWLLSGGRGLAIVQAFKGTLVALAYYLLLSAIINMGKENTIKKWLVWRPLLYTGKISYGLYVYHVLCFSVYLKYFRSPYFLLDFINCVILSYVTASLSYYLLEVRFLKLKDRWTRKNIASMAVSSA